MAKKSKLFLHIYIFLTTFAVAKWLIEDINYSLLLLTAWQTYYKGVYCALF